MTQSQQEEIEALARVIAEGLKVHGKVQDNTLAERLAVYIMANRQPQPVTDRLLDDDKTIDIYQPAHDAEMPKWPEALAKTAAENAGMFAVRDAQDAETATFFEQRIRDLEAVLREAKEGIRLTREYVGEAMLPPIEGWSWYDATRAIDEVLPELQEATS